MTVVSHVWLNGEILDLDTATVSVMDRGFTLADGVFETIMVLGKHPLWLSDHLVRLRHSASCLQIPLVADNAELECAINELMKTSDLERSVLRITLTRGSTMERGLYAIGQSTRPTMLMSVSPWKASTEQQLIVSNSTRRNEHSPLSTIKSLNYGDNLLARQEALKHGATDAILLNGADNLACATVGNIFMSIDDMWYTPSLASGILPGLARRRLIQLLGARESILPAECLRRVKAALISNSLGCSIIRSIEGRCLETPRQWAEVASIYVD